MIKCERDKQASKNATKESDKHSVIWRMFMSSTLQSSLYSWGKNYSDNLHSIKIQKISQWNKCSTYLRNWYPNNQMRSMEWKPLTGKTLHGSICLWLVMKKSSVSCKQRSTYSHILYYVLERWTRTHNQIMHGKTGWRGSKVHQITELWTQLMVSQWNSSGIFSQDSIRCSSVKKSNIYC